MPQLLSDYVLDRLPKGYLLLETDREWLMTCDQFHTGEPTNNSAVAAVKAACHADVVMHIDPYEMLIDAQICTPRLEVLP